MGFFSKLVFIWPIFRMLWALVGEPVWAVAEKVVSQVAGDAVLKAASDKEDTISYCPRCGQTPTGDRRLEEARELAYQSLATPPKRHHLDTALAVNFYLHKRKHGS